MKKILLTGASGNVGYQVLKQLVDKNKYDLTVFDVDNKNTRKKFKPYKDKINIIYGSITDSNLIHNIVKDFDIVIHLAAIIPPKADKEPELAYQVNFEGTRNIVSAIKQNEKGFLLFASSVAVYGDRIENPYIRVTDDLNPAEDYYALLKIECEKMIEEADIDHSIFRLTAIMGKPDIDPLMFHMPLQTKLEILSSVDAARAFVNAIEHTNELNNKTFNLSGGVNCRTTYKSLLRNMFKIYGLNIRYLSVLAFADYNFHCGYFLDSDDLENILHFRNETLESYYERLGKETKGIIRFFSRIFSQPILFFLQEQSEPLQAQKRNNLKLIKKFFKD